MKLIVRDKVTRQCPQTTTFEEKGQSKRILAEALLLTSLAVARQTGSLGGNADRQFSDD